MKGCVRAMRLLYDVMAVVQRVERV
jgi:hypothetical protein